MMDLRRTLGAALLVAGAAAPAHAQADLNDVEMAHVAVTASDIDIGYAHLALALSSNPAIRTFAETMIRDHGAVNAQVAALAKRLGVQAKDNAVSRSLRTDAVRIRDELSGLRGEDFDRAYIENELRYHELVNGTVGDTFIPRIRNAEVRRAFEGALVVFRGHERHARELVRQVAEGM